MERVQQLVRRCRDQRRETIEIERGRHRVGQSHQRLARVVAGAEEQAIDQRLRTGVEPVDDEHDDECDNERGHHARHADVQAAEQHVQSGQQAGVAEGHDGGRDGVDRADAHHGADVEQLVANDRVGDREREDERQLPQLVQEGDRLVEYDLRGRPNDRRKVADTEAGQQHARTLAHEVRRPAAGSAGQHHEQLDERRRPVDCDEPCARSPRVARHRQLQPGPQRRRQRVRHPNAARPPAGERRALGEDECQVHEDRRQERPRHEEQLREPVRPRQVPVTHVHDDRRETEHDEEPRARPARPQQADQRAEGQDEDSTGQILDDVVLERAERHLAARGVFLDQRAAAHEQIAHARAGRMALDFFLELA